MTLVTKSREALAKALAEHRIVYESDGDYGEKQWIACSCSHLSFGDDYWTGETEEDHERHVADSLPMVDVSTLADDEALVERVRCKTALSPGAEFIVRWVLRALAAALEGGGDQ